MEYLGTAAMGFRAQAGTIHLAQLLTDVIAVQQRRGQPLWLISFDVEKCFPSLPWWGLFGVMAAAGVDPAPCAVCAVFIANFAIVSGMVR